MEELTCRATGRWFGKSAMQMLRLDQSRMKYMLQFLKIPEAGWSALSADEVHFRTIRLERKNFFSKRWQAEFITTSFALKASRKSRPLFRFRAVG
jgi:hypothetical protein